MSVCTQTFLQYRPIPLPHAITQTTCTRCISSHTHAPLLNCEAAECSQRARGGGAGEGREWRSRRGESHSEKEHIGMLRCDGGRGWTDEREREGRRGESGGFGADTHCSSWQSAAGEGELKSASFSPPHTSTLPCATWNINIHAERNQGVCVHAGEVTQHLLRVCECSSLPIFLYGISSWLRRVLLSLCNVYLGDLLINWSGWFINWLMQTRENQLFRI